MSVKSIWKTEKTLGTNHKLLLFNGVNPNYYLSNSSIYGKQKNNTYIQILSLKSMNNSFSAGFSTLLKLNIFLEKKSEISVVIVA